MNKFAIWGALVLLLLVLPTAPAWGQNGIPDECDGDWGIIGLAGDADRDFDVDLDDFMFLKINFAAVETWWSGGDFDLDGDTDLDDFVALKNHFGQQWYPLDIPDLNGDGNVDLADAVIVKNDGLYGTAVCLPYSPPTGTIPEPASASLLVCGAVALLRRRR